MPSLQDLVPVEKKIQIGPSKTRGDDQRNARGDDRRDAMLEATIEERNARGDDRRFVGLCFVQLHFVGLHFVGLRFVNISRRTP